MVHANKAMRESYRPDFSACRIPVPSNFNLKYLEKELVNYQDSEIISLLHYGCPISYKYQGDLSRACRNHKGATDFPEHIDSYLEKEIEADSVLGT